MKKKIALSGAFVISLLPMLLNQYGGMRGVQEITGLLNLCNPIGIISVILFIVGVWVPFREKNIGRIVGAFGTTGIVAAEIYEFLTWHVMTITGEVSLRHSFNLAFPEFYLGLIVSLAMVAAYFVIDQKTDAPPDGKQAG